MRLQCDSMHENMWCMRFSALKHHAIGVWNHMERPNWHLCLDIARFPQVLNPALQRDSAHWKMSFLIGEYYNK